VIREVVAPLARACHRDAVRYIVERPTSIRLAPLLWCDTLCTNLGARPPRPTPVSLIYTASASRAFRRLCPSWLASGSAKRSLTASLPLERARLASQSSWGGGASGG
jgi:hypothetical protein